MNACATHPPSKRALSAKDLNGAVRTKVKANIVRRRLAPLAASKTGPSTAPAPKAPPVAIVLENRVTGPLPEDAAGYPRT